MGSSKCGGSGGKMHGGMMGTNTKKSAPKKSSKKK